MRPTFGFDPFPYQWEGITHIVSRPSTLAVWGIGTGKALRDDQRVLVAEGWRAIGTVSVGDEVYGADGRLHRVTGVFPQGERDLWEVEFRDGATVVCDDEHLWSVRDSKGKGRGTPFRVMTTRQMREQGLQKPGGVMRFFVPVVDPIDYPESYLSIDPYLIGALVGDGGLTQRTPRITTADPELLTLFDLPEGVTIRPYKQYAYGLAGQPGRPNLLTEGLRELGLMGLGSHEKFVPESILCGSPGQRLAFLQGLLDTDGFAGSTVEYVTVSPKLAEGVVELVRSLGGLITVKDKITTHRMAKRCHLRLPPGMSPFRLSRKADGFQRQWDITRPIVAIRPVGVGPATCITVEGDHFVTEGHVVTHNSHLAYASSVFMIGEGLVDQVIVVCESNKMVEWPPDFKEHTTLTVGEYRGSFDRRRKLMSDPPQTLVVTYETLRNDSAVFVDGKLTDGPLVGDLSGRRVLIFFDEVTKLGNRGSKTYKAIHRLLSVLRRNGSVVAVGLTGTPVETSIESVFNYMRILAPQDMPTVKEFNETYVVWRDQFGTARQFRHIDESDRWFPHGERPTFMELLAPSLTVKSKRDPDVIAQFPELPEPESIFVELPKAHRDFYDALDQIADTVDADDRRWFNLLRQVAVWPLALTYSKGDGEATLAQQVVAEVGEAFLESLGSAKADRIVTDIRRIVDQGDQIIAFTFFGQSILRLFGDRLDGEDIPTTRFHGGLSLGQKREALDEFRSGRTQVLLASDAGAKGINLPEAVYVANIEPPTKWSTWDQRRGRAHRVDSDALAVWTLDYVALDTIEEAVVGVNLRRQEWDDQIQGDAAKLFTYQSAAERRAMIQEARERATKGAP